MMYSENGICHGGNIVKLEEQHHLENQDVISLFSERYIV